MEIFGRGVTGTTDQPRSASDEIDLYQLDKTIELLTFRGAFRETRFLYWMLDDAVWFRSLRLSTPNHPCRC